MPSNDARPQAIARAKDRYHLLIKTAGQTMSGGALAALKIYWGMARTDKERKFRLRPQKPRPHGDERVDWSSGFKLLMHYARSTRKAGNRGTYGGKGRSERPYLQRCAVRVTYLNNKTRGL